MPKRPEQETWVTGGQVVGKRDDAGPSDVKPENFYIAASSGEGGSSQLNLTYLRSPDHTIPRIHRYVEDRKTPYRSIPEFVRDAIQQRLKQLDDFSKDSSHEWGWWQRISENQRMAQEAEYLDREYGRVSQLLKDTFHNGNDTLFNHTIETARYLAMRTSEPHRSWFRELVENYSSGRIEKLKGGEERE